VHGERIAMDVRVVEASDGSVKHRLAPRGGSHESGDLWGKLASLDQDGCARYVVTDVSRGGMLAGPTAELYRAVTGATTAPVIASGGVSSIKDLIVLAEAATALTSPERSIVGKALYAGRFTPPEAIQAMRRVS
jgi:phosphoribosylformimino-5-aminoimidazole carboxamide ribonucleotide (ProFAR) isomerase